MGSAYPIRPAPTRRRPGVRRTLGIQWGLDGREGPGIHNRIWKPGHAGRGSHPRPAHFASDVALPCRLIVARHDGRRPGHRLLGGRPLGAGVPHPAGGRRRRRCPSSPPPATGAGGQFEGEHPRRLPGPVSERRQHLPRAVLDSARRGREGRIRPWPLPSAGGALRGELRRRRRADAVPVRHLVPVRTGRGPLRPRRCDPRGRAAAVRQRDRPGRRPRPLPADARHRQSAPRHPRLQPCLLVRPAGPRLRQFLHPEVTMSPTLMLVLLVGGVLLAVYGGRGKRPAAPPSPRGGGGRIKWGWVVAGAIVAALLLVPHSPSTGQPTTTTTRAGRHAATTTTAPLSLEQVLGPVREWWQKMTAPPTTTPPTTTRPHRR